MAAVGSHLPLASISVLALGEPALDDSATNSSLTILGQSCGYGTTSAIDSPIERNKYSRPGYLKPIHSELVGSYDENAVSISTASDFETAIYASKLGTLYEDRVQTPVDLESRGAAETMHPFADLEVGKRWREIQGENNWEGLLDPIDPVLRGEVIRYGEFAQVTYDAFDNDTHSRFCGSCRYSKERLLKKVGLENRGYEVTDFLYATGEGNVALSKFFKIIDLGDTDEKELEDVWDKVSNWMGYVAVSSDPEEIKRLGRRDIVVVWRGTVTNLEWAHDLKDYLTPTGLDPRGTGRPSIVHVKVESGFLQLYKSHNEKSPYTVHSARWQVLHAVKRLVQKFKDEELSITVVGHSLGSALAVLSAYDLAESGVNQLTKLAKVINDWDAPDFGRDPNEVVALTQSPDVKTVPVTVYSFAGPRVGNDGFRDRVEELGVKVLRLVNVHDMVPQVPGVVFNEKLGFLEDKLRFLWRWLDKTLPWTYSHVGVPLNIDNLKSPFLRKTIDLGNAHNLEGYLHVLNGFHGKHRPFSLSIDRDLALVNKSSDLLEKRHSIPPSWWQEENKGLIRTATGRWVPRVRDPEDVPEFSRHKYPSRHTHFPRS